MLSNHKIPHAFIGAPLIALTFISTGCDQNRPQMSDGLDDLKATAQQYLSKLEKNDITRVHGFYLECAVNIKRVKGIRVSETVCDKSNTRAITLRVTDPTARPPSQQLDNIQLTNLSGNTMTIIRGTTKASSSGITITFDRSGQSIVMNRQVARKP
jgi:hypothetical protein